MKGSSRFLNLAIALLSWIALGLDPANAQDRSAGFSPSKALIEAARAEKFVTWYSAQPDVFNAKLANAFQKMAGIEVKVLRLASGSLNQRFSAEAQSNSVAADAILTNAGGPFLGDALGRGWIIPIEKMGLSSVQSGEFPAKWIRPEQGAAIVVVAPWIFACNERTLASLKLAAPRDWRDLLEPKLRGQIILTHPSGSDGYIQLWDFVLRHYGEDYVRQLKTQNPRFTNGGAPSIQSLAAGEGAITLPTVGSLIEGVAQKGAPVKAAVPSQTTGVELAITVAKAAPHPNAARFFVDFVLSREGGMAGATPLEYSVYSQDLPKGYESPRPQAVAENKEKILRLFEGK